MIIGDPKALTMAIGNRRSSGRLTGLTALLAEGTDDHLRQ